MESFFSSLKAERIERFYNAVNRHSAIGYLSPVEFERKVGLAYPSVRQTGSSSDLQVRYCGPFCETTLRLFGHLTPHLCREGSLLGSRDVGINRRSA